VSPWHSPRIHACEAFDARERADHLALLVQVSRFQEGE
jgi:hypothetical protein